MATKLLQCCLVRNRIRGTARFTICIYHVSDYHGSMALQLLQDSANIAKPEPSLTQRCLNTRTWGLLTACKPCPGCLEPWQCFGYHFHPPTVLMPVLSSLTSNLIDSNAVTNQACLNITQRGVCETSGSLVAVSTRAARDDMQGNRSGCGRYPRCLSSPPILSSASSMTTELPRITYAKYPSE